VKCNVIENKKKIASGKFPSIVRVAYDHWIQWLENMIHVTYLIYQDGLSAFQIFIFVNRLISTDHLQFPWKLYNLTKCNFDQN